MVMELTQELPSKKAGYYGNDGRTDTQADFNTVVSHSVRKNTTKFIIMMKTLIKQLHSARIKRLVLLSPL